MPANAVVDLGGRRGVFQPLNETAVFRAVQVGTEQGDIVEILGGLAEGDEVITTGAGALRDGDRIVLAGGRGGRGGRGRRRRGDGRRQTRRRRLRRPRAARAGAARGSGADAGRRHAGRAARGAAAARGEGGERRAAEGGVRGEWRAAPRRRQRQTRSASAVTVNAAGTRNRTSQSLHMSIPRLAIQRPVTMFMISAVITLLGAHLADAAAGRPDAGVRAADADRPHQLRRRRPARDGGADHAADRAGGQRRAGPDARRVVLVRGQQPGAVELRVGHGPRGSGRRSPHAHRPHARPPAGRRRPADDLQVRLEPAADHADRHRGRLRPGHAARDRAERDRAALRARRRRRRRHRQRRPPPADPRRAVEGKDHGAQPVGQPGRRRRCARRTRTRRSARSTRATPPSWSAARASSRASRTSATSSS